MEVTVGAPEGPLGSVEPGAYRQGARVTERPVRVERGEPEGVAGGAPDRAHEPALAAVAADALGARDRPLALIPSRPSAVAVAARDAHPGRRAAGGVDEAEVLVTREEREDEAPLARDLEVPARAGRGRLPDPLGASADVAGGGAMGPPQPSAVTSERRTSRTRGECARVVPAARGAKEHVAPPGGGDTSHEALALSAR